MPFSAGVYTLPTNSFAQPVASTTISSTDATATWADFVTAFSTCVLKDGTQTITANLPMSGFKLTGLGAGSASGNSIRYEQVNGVVTTAGDDLYATGAGTFARLGIGTAGQVQTVNAAATAKRYVSALNKAIYGLTYANNSGDAVNDIDIAAGGAMDGTGAYWMTLASTLTKRSDASWAVGTGNGWLDTGAIGNSDYYIWLIARSDTGVVDSLCSLSSTAPTMPANYDYKRLIGWFKRVGGTIVAFTTYETEGGGLELMWSVPTLEINLSNTLSNSRRVDALKVPLDFSVEAHFNVSLLDNSSTFIVWICCPDQTDAAPSLTAAPLANGMEESTSGGVFNQLRVRTSATGTIASRASIATVDFYGASTMGFKWARRN